MRGIPVLLLAALVLVPAASAEDVKPERHPHVRARSARRVARVTTAADPDGRVRAELEAVRASVEAAVTGARRPLSGGAYGPRVYHLEGYGSVVVLAPRSLPRAPRAGDRQAERALAAAARTLEESLKSVRSVELRRQMESTLAALRQAQRGGSVERRAAEAPRPPGVEDAMRAEAERLAMLSPHAPLPPEIEFGRLHEMAESFRLEAERARARAEKEVRTSLGMAEPALPAAPAAPAPPAAVAAPDPPSAPLPEQAPQPMILPPQPPWRFWIETEETAETAEDALARVREALVRGMLRHRTSLSHLAPAEYLVVAVDFLPRYGESRPGRTLMARVRRQDLDAHRSGQLTADQLRERVVFEEF